MSEKIYQEYIIAVSDSYKKAEKEFSIKIKSDAIKKIFIQYINNLLNIQITLIYELARQNLSINKLKNVEYEKFDQFLLTNKMQLAKAIEKIFNIKNYNLKYYTTQINSIETTPKNKKFTQKNNYIKKHVNKFENDFNKTIQRNKPKAIIKKEQYIKIENGISCDTNLKKNNNNYNKHINPQNTLKNFNHSSIEIDSSNKKLNPTIPRYNICFNNKAKNQNLITNNTNNSNYADITNDNSIYNNCLSLSTIKKNIQNKIDEENPITKVKNIIMNAKRNASLKKENEKIRRRNHSFVLRTNIHTRINSNQIQENGIKEDKSFDYVPSIRINSKHVHITSNTENSFGDSGILGLDEKMKNIKEKKDRESIQILVDGMENMRNKLNFIRKSKVFK